MRLLLAILVIVQLFLRGAEVPHVHAAQSDVHGHANRPHVHLAGHGGHHARAHHHHDGREHGHAHDTMHAKHAETGLPGTMPTPDHDDDAVYGSDDTVMLRSAVRPSPKATPTRWLALPVFGMFISPSVADMRLRRVRPPGDGAATIHTRLPHVLRV